MKYVCWYQIGVKVITGYVALNFPFLVLVMYVTGLRKKLRIVVGLLLETLSVARSTCLRKTAGAKYRV
jgi:hypothetical protein